MDQMSETPFQYIKRLLEDGNPQKALEELGSIDSLTKEDDYQKMVLQIQVYNDLKRIEDALILFNHELIELTKLLGKYQDLADVLVMLANTLMSNDRFNEALSIIEIAEELFNDVEDENDDIIRSKASVIKSKGIVHYYKGKLDITLIAWQKCLEIYKTLEDKGQVAATLGNIGLVYLKKGKLSLAGNYFKESLIINQELGKKKNIASSYNNLGTVYQANGELDLALEHYERSLEIKEELDDHLAIGKQLNNVGEIYQAKGELTIALDYYQRSLEIIKDFGNDFVLGLCYDNLGHVYFAKGDLDAALENHKEALMINEEIGHSQQIAFSLNRLGLVYQSRGNYEESFNCFSKALTLRKQIGNDIEAAETLYNLVVLTIQNDAIKEGKEFLQQLEQISRKEENKVVNQQYRLAKALLLKTSKRLQKKNEAQRIFETIAHEEIVKHELTIFSMLNLTDLLLEELRVMEGEEEVLREIKELTRKLLEIAKGQYSFSLLVQTYLLQSKLSLLELDVHKAESLLTQARLIAEEKGLWQLFIVTSNEVEVLRCQLIKWNDLIKRNASFLERVELAQVNQIIKGMIQSKVEDVSALPRFAADQIRVSLFKMGMNGPEVVVSQQLLYVKDELYVLKEMALFYIISLGQGQSAAINTGLFGPLPVPTVPDHVGIVYAFFIKDPDYADPRCKGITYAVIVFSMPRSYNHFFQDRKKVAQILDNALKPLSSIKIIDLNFLESLKFHTLGLELKTDEIDTSNEINPH